MFQSCSCKVGDISTRLQLYNDDRILSPESVSQDPDRDRSKKEFVLRYRCMTGHALSEILDQKQSDLSRLEILREIADIVLFVHEVVLDHYPCQILFYVKDVL